MTGKEEVLNPEERGVYADSTHDMLWLFGISGSRQFGSEAA
jgi:hypothetical protein